MRKLSVYILIIVISAFMFACSNPQSTEPSPEDNDAGESPLKIIETGINKAGFDTPQENVSEVKLSVEDRVKIFKERLDRLNIHIRRLANYEEKNPNEEAYKYIKNAHRLLRHASISFDERKFKDAHNFAHRAKKNAKEAIIILKNSK